MSALATQNSHVAATAVMPSSEIMKKLHEANLPTYTTEERANDNKELFAGLKVGEAKELGLGMAEGGLAPPGAGMFVAPIGMATSLFTRDFFTQREMQAITDQYRDLLAEKMGLPADAITEEHVKFYATQNEAFAAQLVQTAHKRESRVMNNGAGISGMLAGGAAGAALGSVLPGPGNVIGFIGGMAGSFLGYDFGESLGKYLTDTTDASDPKALIEALQKKREDGNMISAKDVFTLRMAQNPEIQKSVAAVHGDNFAALDKDTQMEVMNGMPLLLQQAAKDATCCNFPNADVRQLMFGEMQSPVASNQNQPSYANQPTQWMAPTANSNIAPNGWAERIMKERELAAANQNVQI